MVFTICDRLVYNIIANRIAGDGYFGSRWFNSISSSAQMRVRTFAVACSPVPISSVCLMRRWSSTAYGIGLENRRIERFRGFKSYTPRFCPNGLSGKDGTLSRCKSEFKSLLGHQHSVDTADR